MPRQHATAQVRIIRALHVHLLLRTLLRTRMQRCVPLVASTRERRQGGGITVCATICGLVPPPRRLRVVFSTRGRVPAVRALSEERRTELARVLLEEVRKATATAHDEL